jgi:hypothetical protein
MTKIIAAAALALALQTPSSPPANSYGGTWIAEHAGTTFVRLELQDGSKSVTGRISLGKQIQVDAQGQVAKAEAAPGEFRPLVEIVRGQSRLSFASKDGKSLDHFEMRLLGPDVAELLFILSDEDKKELAAEGNPLPKPFRLKKISS